MSGGDWLFRQGELTLGPVPAKHLVEKLYAGEVDGATEISLLGGRDFRRLSEVDYFKLHLAKAEAKRRVDQTAKLEFSKASKGRNLRLAVVGILALGAAAAVAVVATRVAVHNPLKDDPEALAFAELGISMDIPVIKVAKRNSTEELVEYPGAPVDTSRRGSTRPASGKSSSDNGALAARPAKARPGKLSNAAQDPDGMQMATFDQDAINTVVAGHQKSLYPCLVEEAKRKPGLTAKIPIEFVIGNDGRVAKVWVDHQDFKTGPLSECLLKSLQRWPFKSYEGERATVGLSFNVGKK